MCCGWPLINNITLPSTFTCGKAFNAATEILDTPLSSWYDVVSHYFSIRSIILCYPLLHYFYTELHNCIILQFIILKKTLHSFGVDNVRTSQVLGVNLTHHSKLLASHQNSKVCIGSYNSELYHAMQYYTTIYCTILCDATLPRSSTLYYAALRQNFTIL